MSLFAGIDASNYPGKLVMDAIWATSNIYWTGMYLDSPAPVPGEVSTTKPKNGHNRMGGIGAHSVGSWMRAWGEIYDGTWGILPIYWGHQDPANEDGPIDLRESIAVANAEDAALKAISAGIPSGAVLYLDWEIGGTPSAAGITYCRTWFRRLSELGYRPGVYCHPPSSQRFRLECPHMFVWSVNLASQAGGISIVDNQLILDTPSLVVDGGEPPDRDAIARQWKHRLGPPPGGPISGFPSIIDADVAAVQDPAFPERRNQPMEIRSGPITATTGTLDWLAAYAVRRGKVVRVTWSPGAESLDADLVGSMSTGWLNPFVPISATRQDINGATVEWFAALGWDEAENDSTWRIRTFRGEAGGAWEEIVLFSGSEIEPLPGTVISQRRGATPEVFALDRNAGAIAGARWDETLHAWTTPQVLMAPNGPAAPFPIRTNGFAALSRAPGLLDLFFVGTDSLVRTSYSTSPSAWSDSFVIGDPTVRVHAMANLAVISPSPDRIEVVFIGRRDGDPNLRLYAIGWSQGQQWASPGTREIGGSVPLEPMSRIAISSRRAEFVDVFVVDQNGQLHNTYLTTATGTWTGLRPVGGAQVKVADVVASSCRGPDDVEVLVADRDGSVWATHWDQTLPNYQPLERITLLDLDLL